MLEVPSGSRAVVTGASSGIGEAIARKLAERRIPVLLVARSAGRLADLASDWSGRWGTPVETLALDLAAPGAARALFEATEGAGKPVDLLVLNAGFAWSGTVESQAEERLAEMLRLNVVSVAEASRLFLAAMKGRGRGRILTVASTAAFLPCPYFAAYAATKAFVLSLTEALRVEAEEAGVVVSCLCPGYTRTRFHEVARMKTLADRLFSWQSADTVAEAGLVGLERGKAVIVTNPLDRIWIAAGRFVPRALPTRFAARAFRPVQRADGRPSS